MTPTTTTTTSTTITTTKNQKKKKREEEAGLPTFLQDIKYVAWCTLQWYQKMLSFIINPLTKGFTSVYFSIQDIPIVNLACISTYCISHWLWFSWCWRQRVNSYIFESDSAWYYNVLLKMCCSTFLNPSGGWAWLLYMNRNSNRYFALSQTWKKRKK